jgi:hypothetical protein
VLRWRALRFSRAAAERVVIGRPPMLDRRADTWSPARALKCGQVRVAIADRGSSDSSVRF